MKQWLFESCSFTNFPFNIEHPNHDASAAHAKATANNQTSPFILSQRAQLKTLLNARCCRFIISPEPNLTFPNFNCWPTIRLCALFAEFRATFWLQNCARSNANGSSSGRLLLSCCIIDHHSLSMISRGSTLEFGAVSAASGRRKANLPPHSNQNSRLKLRSCELNLGEPNKQVA